MELTDEQVKQMLQELAMLPDFNQLAFPEHWAEKYQVPITKPKPLSFQSYLQAHRSSQLAPVVSTETRLPQEGGVRPMPEEEPLTLTINAC
jgi:hypothetical protein